MLKKLIKIKKMKERKKMNKGRKAISMIITSILLILISITAVIIVAGVLIPFVKDTLTESKDCFESIGKLTIDTEHGYACSYNKIVNKQTLNITVKRGEIEIKEFRISVGGEGYSESFEIKEGEVGDEDGNIEMLDGSENLEIPGKGVELTYSIDTNLELIEYAEVYPVLESGKLCEEKASADVEAC